ncbi:MAG: hypothetical protein IKP86_14560 [Anaerolineaceae bacterium]|nr:hypothetical protein [Anaerolineaceae bacterium]
MFRYFFLLFFFLFPIISPAAAQSDDITFLGNITSVYFLKDPFVSTVITGADEKLEVTVSDIVTDTERILVRFYLKDLPENWTAKVTDDLRIYGSYLPAAEAVLADGAILTPSSSSRYSILEYNDRLILGGLLVFYTEKTPQTFYLNFNQIPFDTQPLKEGFSKAVILTQGGTAGDSARNSLSASANDIEFTLSATAQTNRFTMLQPAVRMERTDELLSKFGWISVTDSVSGKRFAVTRGNLYGFNLTDDAVYSPAHAYVFYPKHMGDPLEISMDHAYVVRSFSPVHTAHINLHEHRRVPLLQTGDFSLELTEVQYLPENDRIRLYIDPGDKVISDISFRFRDLPGPMKPSVSCGIDPERENFACDIFFDESNFPSEEISFDIDAIEYRKEGPWTIRWTPAEIQSPDRDPSDGMTLQIPYTYDYPLTKEQPEEIREILDSIAERNTSLIKSNQWICESYELDYRFTDTAVRDLIRTDQYSQYLTHYINENWFRADEDGTIRESVRIVRSTRDDQIYSALWYPEGKSIDLIHGLCSADVSGSGTYSCFEDFSNLAKSSAEFLSMGPCDAADGKMQCLVFYQSLNGMAQSSNSQMITFEISPEENNFIRKKIIQYNSGALELTQTTLTLENRDELPEDILALIRSIE